MILDTIVQQKKEEVSSLKRNGIILPDSFVGKPHDKSRGFKQALLDYKGVSIIAEVNFLITMAFLSSLKSKRHPLQKVLSVPISIQSRLPGITSLMVLRLFRY